MLDADHFADQLELADLDGPFGCVTVIEVVEHLDADEIPVVLAQTARLLAPGGPPVTPNDPILAVFTRT